MGAAQEVSGKTAFITGGSGAIAGAVAARLIEKNAAILLMGRRESALIAMRERLLAARPQARIEIFAGDAARRADVEAGLAAAHAMQSRLDILIGTVGGGDFRPLLKHDEESFRAALDLNLLSAFLLVRYGVPLMSDGGSIVLISSSVARKYHEFLVPYSTAKAALDVFVEASSAELARHRVRINAVRPGFTRSGGTEALFAMPDALAKTVEMIPLGRPGEPEDIAGAVAFLAGPEASFITGQTIAVDGGGEVNVITAPRRRG